MHNQEAMDTHTLLPQAMAIHILLLQAMVIPILMEEVVVIIIILTLHPQAMVTPIPTLNQIPNIVLLVENQKKIYSNVQDVNLLSIVVNFLSFFFKKEKGNIFHF